MNLLPLGGPEIAPGAVTLAGTAEALPFPMPAMPDPASATTPLPDAQVAWSPVPKDLATILQTEQPEASAAKLTNATPQICPLEPVSVSAHDATVAASVTGSMVAATPSPGQTTTAESPPPPSHHARPSGSGHRPSETPSALGSESTASGLQRDVADMLSPALAQIMPSTAPDGTIETTPATPAPDDQEEQLDIKSGHTPGWLSPPAAPVSPPPVSSPPERFSAHGSQDQLAPAPRTITAASGGSVAAAPAGTVDKPDHGPIGGNDASASAAHSDPAPGLESVADAPAPTQTAADALAVPAPRVSAPHAALPPPMRSVPPPAVPDPVSRIAIASPRFIQDVGIAISRKPGGLQPGDELVLQIEPADFGQIRVELRFAPDGRLEAVVSADQSRVLDQLRAHAADLHRSLIDAGGRADVAPPRFEARADGGSVSSSQGGNAHSGHAGNGGQSGHQQGHAQHGQRAYLHDPSPLVAPQRLRAAALTGRLDLIA